MGLCLVTLACCGLTCFFRLARRRGPATLQVFASLYSSCIAAIRAFLVEEEVNMDGQDVQDGITFEEDGVEKL